MPNLNKSESSESKKVRKVRIAKKSESPKLRKVKSMNPPNFRKVQITLENEFFLVFYSMFEKDCRIHSVDNLCAT